MSGKYSTIFIANLAEISLDLVSHMTPDEAEYEIAEDHHFCDRFLFSVPNDSVLITPHPLDRDFFRDGLEILTRKNVQNLFPWSVDASICQGILRDQKLFPQLVEIIKNNPQINIVSYSITKEYYELLAALKNKNLQFTTPESPEIKDWWVQEFYDTKAGFHQGALSLGKEFPSPPEGAICSSEKEIVGWGAHLLNKNPGCVLKTNSGLAGAGVKIITKEEAGSHPEEYISKILASEPYWQEYPVIVEAYIPPNLSICGGAPSVEVRVMGNEAEFLYSCGMRIISGHIFRGIEIGEGAVPPEVNQIMKSAGETWGNFLAKNNYRGYFDIDFVAGFDGQIHPLESNIRRTGGTHVFETAQTIFGDAWQTHYYVSNNRYPSEKLRRLNYPQLKSLISSCLYSDQQKKGVILTVVSALPDGWLGYMIIGDDKTDALKIESHFLSLLKE